MIRENAQISAVKLAVCYQYRSSGEHGPNNSLYIKLWGIDKNGEELIASCPLNTTDDYIADEYVSSVITGIPDKDYPFMYFSYDISEAEDFHRINGVSNLFIEVKPFSDILDTNIETNAV